MPCACGKNNKQATEKWMVSGGSGSPKTYSSEIEAKAAAQRTGGTAKRV